MKYIDADRLKAEIDKRLQENADKALLFGAAFAGRTAEDNEIVNLIDSLQPEMSEMEISLLSWLSDDTSGEIPMERMKHIVKARAAELLDIAKQQLNQSGELLTQEQPVDGLEEKDFVEEVRQYYSNNCTWDALKQPMLSIITRCARHFAEWGARHSINWGDVQLLDTFILELSREEKDGADWGDSEKFYTEVLRRFHEFNDKKIPEIVAEWGAEHLKK